MHREHLIECEIGDTISRLPPEQDSLMPVDLRGICIERNCSLCMIVANVWNDGILTNENYWFRLIDDGWRRVDPPSNDIVLSVSRLQEV